MDHSDDVYLIKGIGLAAHKLHGNGLTRLGDHVMDSCSATSQPCAEINPVVTGHDIDRYDAWPRDARCCGFKGKDCFSLHEYDIGGCY